MPPECDTFPGSHPTRPWGGGLYGVTGRLVGVPFPPLGDPRKETPPQVGGTGRRERAPGLETVGGCGGCHPSTDTSQTTDGPFRDTCDGSSASKTKRGLFVQRNHT